MAVELAEYVEQLRAKVNPPGEDLFPGATPEDWALRLSNAFWDGFLHKMFQGHRENDGVVSPVTAGGADLAREQVQMVILYAALDALLAKLVDLKTQFKGGAGPVSFEYQRSAQVLVQLIKDRRAELAQVTAEAARTGTTSTWYIDSVSRRLGLETGAAAWVR